MRDVATLLEALPYIRDFHGQTVVIKYGGAAMTDPALREEFARDVVLLKYVGMNPVVVHGGGPDITPTWSGSGMEVEFVDGLRVSDEATVEVAKMVLVGKVRTRTSSCASAATGSRRSGSAATTGGYSASRGSAPGGEDIGFVGEIERVDVDVLNHIAADYIPVVASVGADREGHSYNVNADEAAGAVARALGAYKVIFLTDVEGWLADPADPGLDLAGDADEVESGARGVERRHAAEAPGLPRRDPRRRHATRTSSTAASRTRCCSSCSPTRASARRSGRRHERSPSSSSSSAT